MKQFQLTADVGGNIWRAARADIPEPDAGQVLVKVHAVSLNYRDIIIARNTSRTTPLIPCSDGAGVVAAIGPGVKRLKVGDRIAGTFFQTWIDGPIRANVHDHALGGAIDGLLSEYALLSAEGAVAVPDELSFDEAATLPCAALTAWNALIESCAIKPGNTVLLLGTGGVSMFALQFAKTVGARALMISSSDDKLERAKQFGADDTLNYRSRSDWGQWALEVTDGSGVDVVVDVGGPGTLEQSLHAARTAGTVTLTGVLTGFDGGISPVPALLKSLRLQGIYVGSRAMFERMLSAIKQSAIHPVIDRTFDLDQAPQALAYMQTAQHVGKVVIRVR
jgi:NADPH:quinone reductase-like Zn-dependent oxidoreductase